MYEIPDKFEVEQFVGRQLVQVAFSVNTVTMFFGVDLSIDSTHAISLRHRSSVRVNRIFENKEVRIAGFLEEVLGQEVTAVGVDDRRSLDLRFGADYELRIHGDSERFECYQVTCGDETFIV